LKQGDETKGRTIEKQMRRYYVVISRLNTLPVGGIWQKPLNFSWIWIFLISLQ